MLRRRQMMKKHIQMSRACIKKAKQCSRQKRKRFYMRLAEGQLKQAEIYAETLEDKS